MESGRKTRETGAPKLNLPVSGELTGAGLFSEIGNRILGLKQGLLNGYRTNLGPDVRAVLATHGHKTINQVLVGRHTLSTRIDQVVRVFGKNLPEKIYHLFLVLLLDDGTKILAEKNQVINVQEFNNSMNFEKLEFSLPQATTLNQFLENTKNRMGPNFTRYSATSTNCQNFALNAVLANGIRLSPEQVNWIVVEASTFTSDFWKFLANKATDLASVWDLVQKGAGKKHKPLNLERMRSKLIIGLRGAQDGRGIKDVLERVFAKLAGWAMGKFFGSINESEGIVSVPIHKDSPTSSIDQGRYMEEMIRQIKGKGQMDGSGLLDFITNLFNKMFSKTYSDSPSYGIPYQSEQQTGRLYKY